VPIQGAVRIRGLLILGPKKSQEPYTGAERKLLESIAAQLSVAHENCWLTNERVSAVLAERNRMARELHDNLAQGFAGISLHLQSAAKTIGQAPHTTALKHIEQARALTRESIAEARRSVHELRSTSQVSNDLIGMLRELAAKLSDDCFIDFETQCDALPELPGESRVTFIELPRNPSPTL
jgi:signal transduction histidine kinase